MVAPSGFSTEHPGLAKANRERRPLGGCRQKFFQVATNLQIVAIRLQPVFVLIACKTGRFRFPGGVFRGGFRLFLFKLGLFVEHLQHVPQSLVLSRFAACFPP